MKDTLEIIGLEIELLQFDTRHNPNRLNELLADDFIEYASSGSMYDKKSTLASLPTETVEESEIEYSNFQVQPIAPDIFQVLYRTTRYDTDRTSRQALRSSLWRKVESGWQMFFHQGTPTQD